MAVRDVADGIASVSRDHLAYQLGSGDQLRSSTLPDIMYTICIEHQHNSGATHLRTVYMVP